MNHFAPAFCPKHGIFPAVSFPVVSHNISFQGCITDCPTCGGASEIIPGTYDSTADGLNILLDPSISPAALAALKALAERVQRNELSAVEAQAEAEKIAPGGGRLFDVANWSDTAKSTLYASVIAAAALIYASRSSDPAPTTVNVTVNPVIERVVREQLGIQVIGNVPMPIPRPKQRR